MRSVYANFDRIRQKCLDCLVHYIRLSPCVSNTHTLGSRLVRGSCACKGLVSIPTALCWPKMPKRSRNWTKKAERDAARLMRTATEKIRNLGPVNIGPLKMKVTSASKTNIGLEVTNPLPKENLEQELPRIFEVISGFMKWKYPNNEVLDPEIKKKDAKSLLSVKGKIKSGGSGNPRILHIGITDSETGVQRMNLAGTDPLIASLLPSLGIDPGDVA